MAKTSSQKKVKAQETHPKAQAPTPLNDTAYDKTPYSSYPFSQTSPALIQGIARIFGLNAPDPNQSRILEIGCASGNNIIAIANAFPGSTCIGIDYAAKQIEQGNVIVKQSALKNVELKHLSVMDVDDTLGKFDYIICHGVLSWVPPEVQDKILQVCKANLTENGVAYVSYNTLPGWNSVRSAREMMLYHTAHYTSPEEKAAAARQILKFVGDAMRAYGNQSAKVMDRELEILNSQPDSYLLHEHLEDNNHQFYFHQFNSMAEKHGLQYLAETAVDKMYSGNFSSEIASVLETSTDIVRTEQYMDFIYDRRFRSTLVCHKERQITRNLDVNVLMSGYIAPRFSYPEGFATYDLTKKATLKFDSSTGMSINSDDPIVHAIMRALLDAAGKLVQASSLVDHTHQLLQTIAHPFAKASRAEQEAYVCQCLMRYLFLGGLLFYGTKPTYAEKVAPKPKVSPLAMYHASTQSWVSNMRQEHTGLTPFDNKLIPLLNGTQDVNALVENMLPFFESKELILNESGKPVEDMALIREKLPPFIQEACARYAQLALLID